MNRRNFLSLLLGGAATAAVARSFPFRVFSFPSEIKPVNLWTPNVAGGPALTAEMIRRMVEQMKSRIGSYSPTPPICLHPIEFARLKSLGYIQEIEMRHVLPDQLPPDMRGSALTYGGLPVIVTPHAPQPILNSDWALPKFAGRYKIRDQKSSFRI